MIKLTLRGTTNWNLMQPGDAAIYTDGSGIVIKARNAFAGDYPAIVIDRKGEVRLQSQVGLELIPVDLEITVKERQ